MLSNSESYSTGSMVTASAVRWKIATRKKRERAMQRQEGLECHELCRTGFDFDATTVLASFYVTTVSFSVSNSTSWKTNQKLAHYLIDFYTQA